MIKYIIGIELNSNKFRINCLLNCLKFGTVAIAGIKSQGFLLIFSDFYLIYLDLFEFIWTYLDMLGFI